jgi:hypothetical protein
MKPTKQRQRKEETQRLEHVLINGIPVVIYEQEKESIFNYLMMAFPKVETCNKQ